MTTPLRELGRSGVKTGRLGLGCATFGREISEADAFAIMDHAVALGIRLFDTAEAYGGGQARLYRKNVLGADDEREVSGEMHSSEKIVGRWMKSRGSRSQIVLLTKVTSNFTLKYTVPVGSGDLYAYTDWVYRSKVNFFLYESTEFTGKALLEGGLRLGYAWGGGKYDAAVYVRNITNQIRVVGGIDFNNLTGFVNEPRTYGVAFKAMF